MDEASDWTVRWSFDGAGMKIGRGWGHFLNVLSGDDGIIYAIAPNGDLLYYRDDARNGTVNSAFGGTGQKLASGRDAFAEVFYGGDRVFSSIARQGLLLACSDVITAGTSALSAAGRSTTTTQLWW